jgi:hypothetical protein
VADPKLGPLFKQNAAQVTIVLPEPLKEELVSMQPSTVGSTYHRNLGIDAAHAIGVPSHHSPLVAQPRRLAKLASAGNRWGNGKLENMNDRME